MGLEVKFSVVVYRVFDWIHMAQDGDCWRAFMYTALKLFLFKMRGIF
jgi:hypothetical protein